MAKQTRQTIPTETSERHDMLSSLLGSMHQTIRELAVKKQDGALSKTRIAMINRLLADIKDLLRGEPSATYLELLDEALVPQNADALLVLGHYSSAMKQFREKYSSKSSYDGDLTWRTR